MNRSLLGISLISIFFLLPTLSPGSQLSLVIFGGLALFYSILQVPGQKTNSTRGLKHLFYIKPILLILVWTYLTLYLPVLENQKVNLLQLVYLTSIWISLIFANTLIFDIRDISEDHDLKLRTIANIIGKIKSHTLIKGILLFQSILIIFFSIQKENFWIAPILLSVTFAYYLFNHYYSKQIKIKSHLFILADLILVLPFILILIPFLFVSTEISIP